MIPDSPHSANRSEYHEKVKLPVRAKENYSFGSYAGPVCAIETPTPRRGTHRMEATGTTRTMTMTMSNPSPPCGMGSITRDGGAVFVLQRRWPRFEYPRIAAPWGSCPKVWPPCSFSNKEPSKTSVWLPCSGHVQEQKRPPPRLADESNSSLPESRQNGGLCCVRACVCDACVLVFVQALAARPT
jgi:hypothetical protein